MEKHHDPMPPHLAATIQDVVLNHPEHFMERLAELQTDGCR